MRTLGVIPARGGSKGIPQKNLAAVGGRPLLAYTADAARGSRLSRTCVSTDDPAIADAARRLGLEVPFMRPPELAGDETPMLPVLTHAVEVMAANGFAADVVVLLQPTSPFRRAEHVDRAIELLDESGADSVVSVVAVPHQFTPSSLMRIEDGRLRPFADGPMITRRQDKPLLYARNGPAVLATRVRTLRGGSLYGHDIRPLVMTARESLDIDTLDDLALADLLLSTR